MKKVTYKQYYLDGKPVLSFRKDFSKLIETVVETSGSERVIRYYYRST